MTGEPRRLPPGIDLAAYRVAQEAMTNALKHAGGARTQVLVEHGANTVAVSVLDDGRAGGTAPADTGGTGQGLASMRERVALYGGTFDAGPRPGGGFAVRVVLPTTPGTER